MHSSFFDLYTENRHDKNIKGLRSGLENLRCALMWNQRHFCNVWIRLGNVFEVLRRYNHLSCVHRYGLKSNHLNSKFAKWSCLLNLERSIYDRLRVTSFNTTHGLIITFYYKKCFLVWKIKPKFTIRPT